MMPRRTLASESYHRHSLRDRGRAYQARLCQELTQALLQMRHHGLINPPAMACTHEDIKLAPGGQHDKHDLTGPHAAGGPRVALWETCSLLQRECCAVSSPAGCSGQSHGGSAPSQEHSTVWPPLSAQTRGSRTLKGAGFKSQMRV